MKRIALIILIVLPFIAKADPEYSTVLRYLVNLPSATTDEEAIGVLKGMNVSDEAKKNVSVVVVTEMRRYELAWYMTENGYVKMENIGQMFQKPFADNNTPNKKQASSRTYTDSELVEYAKKFIETGTKVTAGNVQSIKAMNYPQLAAYVNGFLSDDQTTELNVNTLRTLLNKRPVSFEEVKQHVLSTNTLVPLDMLRTARIETLELTQFLIEHGADIHADDVLVNAINMGSIDVVKFLVEKGASTCRNVNTKNDPLENAERFMSKAKSPERKDKMQEMIKYIKPFSKKCPK
ncbi:MAG: hypothetical protein V4638_03090 [Bacteroidota bacterium]